ncbi:MAG: hypothetical protein CW716_02375 [Candidatus Bathyarchaeum sp.]|nr:MAG: hypothetical protein CW716_02375 [Candidatus Bathyarchaeum sp.]
MSRIRAPPINETMSKELRKNHLNLTTNACLELKLNNKCNFWRSKNISNLHFTSVLLSKTKNTPVPVKQQKPDNQPNQT